VFILFIKELKFFKQDLFVVIGCAVSGLMADSRTMVDRARVEAQNHWFTYDEKMSIESVAQAVSNLAIQFGDSDDDGNAMSR
jgi:20S proteasome subunit alpha 5